MGKWIGRILIVIGILTALVALLEALRAHADRMLRGIYETYVKRPLDFFLACCGLVFLPNDAKLLFSDICHFYMPVSDSDTLRRCC